MILGTMPGVESLKKRQYYAHPRNAFWRIMGALFDADPAKPYEQRVQILKSRGVAVWDVLQACSRSGSADLDISMEVPNDFAAFFTGHPQIGIIVLNGGKATQYFDKFVAPDCPPSIVRKQAPSTSPAHAALTFEQKSSAWREALTL
jgi:TDG/mug DNA glycosylase family protein